MEKYLSAVREMYSQFKKKEAHPMEKYIGRHARHMGKILEVVGYRCDMSNFGTLIADASQSKGWTTVGPYDVIIKRCEGYSFVSTYDLID